MCFIKEWDLYPDLGRNHLSPFLFTPEMSSQQYQQQRRKFAAAFLALIFILAAVDTAEAGKKEKPGKQWIHREMLHWVVLMHPWLDGTFADQLPA